MKFSNVSVISASALLRTLGIASVYVYGSVYMYQVLGIPLYTVGIIFTISGVIAALSQIYGGRLGDLTGYRRLIIVSYSAGSVLYGAMYFTSLSGTNPSQFTVLFIAAQTMNSLPRPSLNALLALSSDKPLRSFSILRVGANIGWGIGPAAGGFVISYAGYSPLFIMAATTSVMSVMFAFMIEDRKPGIIERKSARLSALPSSFIILGICGLLLFMVQAQESVTLVNYASSIRALPSAQLGFIYMANGFSVLAFQGIAYRISSRMSVGPSFVLGALVYSAGYFTMSFDTDLPEFITSMAVLSIGEDFAFPMGQVIVTRLYGDRNTGFYMGIYNAFMSAGRSVGPSLGGFALSFLVIPQEIWLVATLPGFASAFLFYTALSRKLRDAGVSGAG